MASYFLPTKPYSITDAINRRAATTGSLAGAVASQSADYNGHHNTLRWNDYRQYYVGEYTWNGRNVFVRNEDFNAALDRSIREYESQGKGAFLLVIPKPEDEHLCQNHPRLLPFSDEAREAVDKEWMTWKFKLINEAFNWERQLGIPATSILIQAETEVGYETAVNEALESRRVRRSTPGSV